MLNFRTGEDFTTDLAFIGEKPINSPCICFLIEMSPDAWRKRVTLSSKKPTFHTEENMKVRSTSKLKIPLVTPTTGINGISLDHIFEKGKELRNKIH